VRQRIWKLLLYECKNEEKNDSLLLSSKNLKITNIYTNIYQKIEDISTFPNYNYIVFMF